MTKSILLIAALLATSPAFASATRVLDAQTITNGAATLTLPASTDTILGRNTSDVLTNKTISGASNTISNLAAGSITSGQVSVSQGGTGASSLTLNNVILGNGTSAVQFVAPGTSGNVLTSNGTTWASTALPSAAPTLNGSQASPQSVTAAGGVTLSGLSYDNIAFVSGSPGAVTVTALPSITACTAAGQRLQVIGESATNTVTLQDEANLAGSKLQLNGNWVGGLNSVLNLVCDGAGFWVESSRR